MGQNKIAVILFAISLFIIVAVLTVLVKGLLQTSWSYSYVVEPIDVINIIVTILVTIFAAWYLTKRLSEERFDKELIISDLRDIELCIKKTLELYEESHNNNQILVSINQLHILINRFQRTVEYRKVNMRPLQDTFWRLYGAATNYESGEVTDDIDIPLVQRYGDDLILEVRRIIVIINAK